jgi:hypothetical protein
MAEPSDDRKSVVHIRRRGAPVDRLATRHPRSSAVGMEQKTNAQSFALVNAVASADRFILFENASPSAWGVVARVSARVAVGRARAPGGVAA